MRILLSNDDGVSSPGILLLAKALRKAGHRVFVVAPASDRSGFSHSISFLSGPCKLTEIEEDTWSCSGTPADCVVLALLGGVPELKIVSDEDIPGAHNTGRGTAPETGGGKGAAPDLIVAGINQGANIGTDIIYSGTAAAARQGSLCGIPSLALSLLEGDEWRWDMAAAFAAERLEEMRDCWKADTFVNVNIPNTDAGPSGLAPAFPSIRLYNDRIDVYRAPGGGTYCFARPGNIATKPEAGSDWDVVSGNRASMSSIYIHPVVLPVPAGGA